MRDPGVDEEVAGLLDRAARARARRSTTTTFTVIKAITVSLVLLSVAALVAVRHVPEKGLHPTVEHARD